MNMCAWKMLPTRFHGQHPFAMRHTGSLLAHISKVNVSKIKHGHLQAQGFPNLKYLNGVNFKSSAWPFHLLSWFAEKLTW